VLNEIFQKIATEAAHYLLHQNGFPVSISIATDDTGPDDDHVLLSLLDYGLDPISKNQLPVFGDDSRNVSRFTHMATLCLIPYLKDKEASLNVIEQLVELFEIKPFFQLTIGEQMYELSIAARSLNMTEAQLFWIARKEPARPALFYQVRVSPL
jgi:hypothetical protein